MFQSCLLRTISNLGTIELVQRRVFGLWISYKSPYISNWVQVSAGLDCVFAQDIVAINTEEKQCCVLGELSKRAVITPDVDAVLSSMSDLLQFGFLAARILIKHDDIRFMLIFFLPTKGKRDWQLRTHSINYYFIMTI